MAYALGEKGPCLGGCGKITGNGSGYCRPCRGTPKANYNYKPKPTQPDGGCGIDVDKDLGLDNKDLLRVSAPWKTGPIGGR